jgi:hypothetical protein
MHPYYAQMKSMKNVHFYVTENCQIKQSSWPIQHWGYVGGEFLEGEKFCLQKLRS